MLDRLYVRKKIEQFLMEDIGYSDLTSDNLGISKDIKASVIAKEDGIIAGIDFAKEVFLILDRDIRFPFSLKDGSEVKKGDTVLSVEGSAVSVLKGERVALNILQRLSGIATTASRYAEKIKDLKTRILDTRKTTPGFRAFEKYAVKVGGGSNHRFALYDMVMIKDNHIAVCGGITKAVNRIRENVSPMVKIEVEVSDLNQLKEALSLNVDIIMLDNMSLEMLKEAVNIVNGKVLLEASGNITVENVRDVALTGVDFISSGSIIHSSRWLDLSMKI
ncbi:MAG TPA: carboxylating nicotinate-nucleotide diphosphorylase [Persephonella sp.]|uniref:Probable nicotinate-nucleotide pyrophosphorylase [carboxylating] n=1 Tax=Persephonella marina (strain DSM 14350 / EX-H1) TaxID=123214 RepID=C0QU14_PERMH|nr:MULTISPECIES: carboxylating nicotinate-nucleotide diphosphorylase [Persephonella]ACO03417.1 nicotinate-nucleotide diphosphorylase (carboxylating) [Persephonella marina EX-H1]HCB70204.1 carboxylating nicotinate-nucleotide diphosphorylase [Persephonella sp.]